MKDKFDNNDTLVLMFSKDLTKVLLSAHAIGLDGFYYASVEKIPEEQISRKIYEDTGIKIEPKNWRTVTTLQNIEKIVHVTVLMTIVDIDKASPNAKTVTARVNDYLPVNCVPQLKWLIPLAIDPTVYGSEFNQILMK